jgi:processive 1,2-diacylglycerol beta-glucosyltransferase
MAVADVYLTKPGGLTTTEAIAKRTPMILVNAVPGCETRNYRFLTEQGVALGAKNRRHADLLLKRLLNNQTELECQKKAMECFGIFHAAEEICKILMREHQTHKKP